MSETTTPARAAFSVSNEQRKKLFEVKHPAYIANVEKWQLGVDAYDGTGGFADGTYLDRYPREEPKKFEERQQKARYHNYVETLVDMYARKIFSQNVQRTAEDEGLRKFWDDVTGAGVPMSAFMKEALEKALASSHVGLLLDKTRDEAAGPAKQDEKARPFLTQFLSTEIQDWRTKDDRTTLTAVKLREAMPSQDVFSEHETGDDAIRMLLWTEQEWARVEQQPDSPIDTAAHHLGLVPFVFLTPKPSKTWPLTGKALCGDVNIIRALYNRGSEEDEVLRDQAFSMFTVNVPADGTVKVEEVKAQIGGDIGTTRAMVLNGEAQYITPDQSVAESIRKNIAYLVQELYRAAHMRFQRDSLEAESAESIRLKHDELNASLEAMASACQAAELQIAKLFFAWQAATPEAAAQAFEAAKVNIKYADEFFLEDLESELKAWILAIKQELGQTMEKRVKMRIVDRLEPELDEQTRKTVEGEIDAIIAKPEPEVGDIADALRKNAAVRLGNFAQQMPGHEPPAIGEGAAA
jgi:hypothetical protein